MSSFIPFVSSSPPPMDDGQSFGWDDEDDDDFGNFASAPGVASSSENASGSGFEVSWPESGSAAEQSVGKTGPSSDTGRDVNSAANHDIDSSSALEDGENRSLENGSVPDTDLGKEEESLGEAGEDDDFADFTAFQEDSGSKGRPHIADLDLHKTNHQEMGAGPEHSKCASSVGGSSDPVMEKSRESTATDSGVFSSDLSPLPINESCPNSEGDKAVQSEDETFTDLPQDNQQDSPSSDMCTAAYSGAADSDTQRDVVGEDAGVCSQQLADPSQTQVSAPSTIPDTSLSEPPHEQQINQPCDSDSSLTVQESNVNETDVADSSSPQSQSQQVTSGHDQGEEMLPGATGVPDDLSASSEVENHVDSTVGSSGTHSTGNDTNPTSDSPSHVKEGLEATDTPVDEGAEEEEDWAAFEASHSEPSVTPDSTNQEDPGDCPDLVLRKNSVEFEEEQAAMESPSAEPITEEGEGTSTSVSPSGEGTGSPESDRLSLNDEEGRESTCAPDSSVPVEDVPNQPDEEDDFGDFSTTVPVTANTDDSDIPCNQSSQNQFSDEASPGSNFVKAEEGFEDLSEPQRQDQTVPETEKSEDNSGQKATDNAAGSDDDDDDFGDFSSREAKPDGGNSGNFSSEANTYDDEDDDFGDFSSQVVSSSSAPTQPSNTDNFGAFSTNTGSCEGGDSSVAAFLGKSADDDDFGDFGSQTEAASADSGWADFSSPPSKAEAEEADFGAFSDSKPAPDHSSLPPAPSNSYTTPPASLVMAKEKKFEAALLSCFPGSSPAPPLCEDAVHDSSALENDDTSSPISRKRQGTLEAVLQYGFQYRSASQHTWQVVQHPSRSDPRVKLWGYLQDVDGSPAVLYHWGKSATNSHLFHTLRIDTQNMLIGHKKPAVPIFATGLSLLEPIRGGGRDRGLGKGGPQPVQGPPSSILTPASATPVLVDPSQQDAPKPSQEIPAVDFDWSTSGLTNPLTSKSLDLDFLGVQDSNASDKPSVFQSELLDAPRSSVKPSQPLEDILKSVKPTSVRSRHGNPASMSAMSPEAARVLQGLPDLSFMQSKVLMFPIKN